MHTGRLGLFVGAEGQMLVDLRYVLLVDIARLLWSESKNCSR